MTTKRIHVAAGAAVVGGIFIVSALSFGAGLFPRSETNSARNPTVAAAPSPALPATVSQASALSVPAAASLPSADASPRSVISTSATATAATARFQLGNAAEIRTASADSELLAVRGMLRDYRAAFGQNPVGTNREITRALLGNNPRGVRFNFSADAAGSAPRLDERGQLLDRWGHPYFFHQISGATLEVRSAGPDGVMWNADDEASR